MSRMIHEAIKILELASMNSRSERGGHNLFRLSVSPDDWELKKHIETLDKDDTGSKSEILSLRERINTSKGKKIY